jgi:hypothetical protein
MERGQIASYNIPAIRPIIFHCLLLLIDIVKIEAEAIQHWAGK